MAKASDDKESALSVMQGIEQPDQINADAVKKIRGQRRSLPGKNEFLTGIFSGNRTILSKAITLIESSLPLHQKLAQEIITECLKSRQSTVGSQQDTVSPSDQPSSIQYPLSSIRVGITGVPGVGKSTFIEALGTYLTAKGHKIAVLAIDPSSTRSKGSILGDKTRMEELSVDPNAFIRPSPSAGSLGGVARKTRETIILCEAAGFDVIFVETVGVGQSETAVHSMVDFFLLLMLAGAGDELQGIKRGIIEMADAIVINKADGDNLRKAQIARVEYANALHLYPPPENGWIPVTDVCSSRTKEGIERIWEVILRHHSLLEKTGQLRQKRFDQNLQVFLETIEEGLREHFYSAKEISQSISKIRSEIIRGSVSPYSAAWELLGRYYNKP
ncbi:MAG: methylmalonyl Co-A mutase-associated GTPase MeaB [bacterium]